MPHPERATEALMGSSDGLAVFQSLLQAVAPAAGAQMNAGDRRPTSAHARRVRKNRGDSRPRAQPHRAWHLQRDVERALLVQELARTPEEAADARQAGGAGAGRERRHHRYRRRLCHRLQDRIAQPPQLHRAIPGRGHGRGRNPARHFHHGRAAHRGPRFAALRAARRSGNRRAQPAHSHGRGGRHRALRQLLRRADGGRRMHL